MKLVVTIFDHPKAPITETIELENGWEDIRLIEVRVWPITTGLMVGS
jgi:hypothetical protein